MRRRTDPRLSRAVSSLGALEVKREPNAVRREEHEPAPSHRAASLVPRWERGFTMAAVVMIMAVMAIMLTVAVEAVSFQQRREKEAELIFRGRQIVEGIRLFRSRNGRFPMQLAELATAKPRALRKVWKDPITGKADWVPIFLGQGGTTVPIGIAMPTPTPGPAGPQPGTDARGPVVGVHSRSCADSIMVLDGHTRYCDWKFVFDPTRPGGGLMPGTPVIRPPGA